MFVHMSVQVSVQRNSYEAYIPPCSVVYISTYMSTPLSAHMYTYASQDVKELAQPAAVISRGINTMCGVGRYALQHGGAIHIRPYGPIRTQAHRCAHRRRLTGRPKAHAWAMEERCSNRIPTADDRYRPIFIRLCPQAYIHTSMSRGLRA